MPELPDVTVYVEALRTRIGGQPLEGVRLRSPFLLRTVEPPVADLVGRRVETVRRLGKRIVLGLEGERFAVLHLMVAGRLHWKPPGAGIPGKRGLAAFDFPAGSLLLTEAGTRKRSSLHLVAGPADLAAHDRGGLEVDAIDAAAFAARARSESHTLKRTLTDPRLFSGIGNAYADEILHRARLSPVRLSGRATDDELARLHAAARSVLAEATGRLRAEAAGELPAKVTAFRPWMAVHGKHGEPCPVCGQPVQRIRYASNETNYCARCQNGDRILADRALSRLLGRDWPRTLEEAMAEGPGPAPGAEPPPRADPDPSGRP